MSRKSDDIDHECRNSIVKLRAHFHRIWKEVKEIERDLEELDRHLEVIERSINADEPYP